MEKCYSCGNLATNELFDRKMCDKCLKELREWIAIYEYVPVEFPEKGGPKW